MIIFCAAFSQNKKRAKKRFIIISVLEVQAENVNDKQCVIIRTRFRTIKHPLKLLKHAAFRPLFSS